MVAGEKRITNGYNGTMDWRDILLVLGVSAAPLSELRGGIPLALSLGFSPKASFFLALLGNLLPLPFLLCFLPKLIKVVERLPGKLGRMGRAYLAWQTRRHRHLYAWEGFALFAFVAVPLPGTGAWTGALIAALLGIPARRAAFALALGVVAAGVLVLLASLGLFHLFALNFHG